jgi:CheY-like chemotaxis protein
VPWTSAPRGLVSAAPLDRRSLYTAILEEAGYAVYAVANAFEALQTITRRLPDVVVLGSIDAREEGLAVIKALRADQSTSDVPAIVLAGAPLRSDDPQRSRHTGPTVVLAEPVSADAVLASVDDLTRATPLQRFARRQLRRALLMLAALVQEPGAEQETASRLCALMSRLHAAVIGVDPHGALIGTSRGAEALTGYGRPELAAISVFDARFGANLPLARIWQEYTAGGARTGTAMVRDRAGRTVPVLYEMSTPVQGLDAIAFAHASG